MTVPQAPEDSELIRRAAQGDQSAVRQLFNLHRERLRRMIAVRLTEAIVVFQEER